MLNEENEVFERQLCEIWLDLIHDGFCHMLVKIFAEVKTLDYFLWANGTRTISIEVPECSCKPITRLQESFIYGPHKEV